MVSWKGADFRYVEQKELGVWCSEEAIKGKPRSEAGLADSGFLQMQLFHPVSFPSAAHRLPRKAGPAAHICVSAPAASYGTAILAPVRKERPYGKSLVLLCRSSGVILVSTALSHCHHAWLRANIMTTKFHFPAYAAFLHLEATKSSI